MSRTPRARLAAYGVAVLATGVSLLLRWLLWPAIGAHTPFMTFFPAVILSAYHGGLGPGLLATFLAAASAAFFLLKPYFSFEVHDPADLLSLALFALTGVIISALSASRLRAHRHIAASERRYALTLASIGDAVIATDTRGRVTFLNPAAEALTGWPLADAAGRPLAEVFRIVNEDTRQPVEDPAAKVLRLGVAVGLANHTALLTRDGRESPIDDCGAPIVDDRGAVAGVVLVFRDVSQRRRAEAAEAVRRAHERMELAVRGSNVGVWEVEIPDGDFLGGRQHYVNLWEQLGYEAPPADGAAAGALMHPDDVAPNREAVRRYLAGEAAAYEYEIRFRHRDGSYRTMLARGAAVRDAAGRPTRFVGIIIDVTKRKQAEEALAQERYLLVTLMDNLPDKIYFKDAESRFVRVNRALTVGLGLTDPDRVIGKTDFDLFTDEHARTAREDERQIMRTGEPVVGKDEKETWLDGRVRWVSTTKMPFRDKDGRITGTFGVSRDITGLKLAEEALRESEHRFRVFVDHAADAFFLHGEDSRVLDVNRRACESLGYSRDELIGMSPADFDPDVTPALVEERLGKLAAGETVAFEARHRRKDGTVFPVEVRGKAFREGGRGFLVTLVRDITERKRAEEAVRAVEERFRTLAKATNDAVWDWDLGTNKVWWNEGVLTLFGYRLEDDETDPAWWLERIHPEDREEVEAFFVEVVRGPELTWVDEYRFRCADGSYKDVYDRGYVIRDAAGRAVRMIGAMLDITARTRAEEELRRAKEAAEAANRAKDEFLANVSHEIRTPMGAILGMTELALDTPLTEDQRHYLTTVKSAAENLLGIINDLLDFAKIESGKLVLDSADFSPRDVVAYTLRALAVRAHRKGIELISHLEPDVPDTLVGDSGRLQQVLLNLVSNAVKFTDAGEVEVEVRLLDCRLQIADCRLEEQIADRKLEEGAADQSPVSNLQSAICNLQFSVRDTGIGIPREQQERIFRAFEQEDTSTTRRYGGTGLGLTIASRLVALMGGTISVESEPGRGSTFTFTARFGRRPHPPERAQARPLALPRDLPVLVVDDNETNRHILEGWLRGWGMRPAAVGDAAAALAALRQAAADGRPFPLVLLDARMPDADGLVLAGQIRAEAGLSGARIILLTSGDRAGDAARARELHIDAHLLKPVQMEELFWTIHRLMGRADGGVPTAAEPARGPEAVPAPAPSGAGLRVLVAEDDEFNALLLEQLLGRRGHRVRVAVNGRDALDLAATGAFDLLLLDVHMPELDGFQVVRAIREREQATGGHLPIVALTARSRKEDRERCLSAGMDDFLSKPIRADDLWAAIGRAGKGRPIDRPGPGLLDPRAVLAACAADAAILERMCATFRAELPGDLEAVRAALRDGDAPRLREAAHKLAGVLAAFSTAAGGVASDLESRAARGQFEEARPLAARLEAMAEELMGLVGGLSLDALRDRPGAAADPGRTAGP